MSRSLPRPGRKPKPEREAQARATLVFRDFVRQLERIDARPRKIAREDAR